MKAWKIASALVALLSIASFLPAFANAGRDTVLAHYLALAKKHDPRFAGFSAKRGSAFFHETHTGGHPETRSCTVCHTQDVRARGRTRAGKMIEPMAVSRTPTRFTDLAKDEKWFFRNCRTVLGRECTPQEKGDFIAFMASQ